MPVKSHNESYIGPNDNTKDNDTNSVRNHKVYHKFYDLMQIL